MDACSPASAQALLARDRSSSAGGDAAAAASDLQPTHWRLTVWSVLILMSFRTLSDLPHSLGWTALLANVAFSLVFGCAIAYLARLRNANDGRSIWLEVVLIGVLGVTMWAAMHVASSRPIHVSDVVGEVVHAFMIAAVIWLVAWKVGKDERRQRDASRATRITRSPPAGKASAAQEPPATA